jgi:hypothetical protein
MGFKLYSVPSLPVLELAQHHVGFWRLLYVGYISILVILERNQL